MQGNNYPVVTAFSLVYNTGIHVIAALESIRANNYPNLEHIIIDDCSTDGKSAQLVERWISDNSYPCIFIKHETNQGVCRTLNEILSIATGKYIFGCSDDMIMPERIKTQVDLLEEADNDVCAVYSKAYAMVNNVIREDLLVGGEPGYSWNIPPNGYVLNNLIKWNFIPAVAILLRIDYLKEVGGFDENFRYEDYPTWLKLAERYKFIYSSYIGSIYRFDSSSLSNQISEWELAFLQSFLQLKDQGNPILKQRYFEIAFKAYCSNNSEVISFFKKNKRKIRSKPINLILATHNLGLPISLGKKIINSLANE